MTRIGITGGIGSGKSLISQLLRLEGIPVYDTDWHAKDLQINNAELKAQIKATLGEESYLANGQLNKAYIASKIFNDKTLLKAINDLVHPAVWKDFERWEQKEEEKGRTIVGIESAILYEAHLNEKVDTVWNVTAPVELRIERACKRDNKQREAIEVRIRNQKPDASKGDTIINNDNSHSVIEQVEKALKNMQ